MANSNKNIEQVFKEGFNDFEHKVSSKVWENLDKELFSEVIINNSLSNLKAIMIVCVPFSLMLIATLNINESHSDVEQVDSNKSVNNTVVIDNLSVQKNETFENIETNSNTELIVSNSTLYETEELIEDQKPNEEITIVAGNQDTAKPKLKERPSLPEKPYLNEAYYENKSDRVYANFCITKLSKGKLLVRLKTRQKSIDALRLTGKSKKADELEKEVFNDNKDVIKAFSKHFNFSDVLFFYSSESAKYKSKDLKNMFIDPNTLEVDNSLSVDPSTTFYMMLDIGPVSIPKLNENESLATSLSRALVLKNRDMKQMNRPFPFYTNASSKSHIDDQVIRLNSKLKYYHNLNRGEY